MISYYLSHITTFIFFLLYFLFLVIMVRLLLLVVEKFILKRKLIHRDNRIFVYAVVLGVILATAIVFTYQESHPDDAFYIEHWHWVIRHDLPENCKVIDAEYGARDFYGDGVTAVLYQPDHSAYLEMKEYILSNKLFRNDSWSESPQLTKLLENNDMSLSDFDTMRSYGDCMVAFRDKENLILLHSITY